MVCLRLIKFKRIFHVFKPLKSPANKHGCVLAMCFYITRVVGDDNHRSILTLFKEFYTTFFMEMTISYSHNFIYQKAVKFNYHADCKG